MICYSSKVFVYQFLLSIREFGSPFIVCKSCPNKRISPIRNSFIKHLVEFGFSSFGKPNYRSVNSGRWHNIFPNQGCIFEFRFCVTSVLTLNATLDFRDNRSFKVKDVGFNLVNKDFARHHSREDKSYRLTGVGPTFCSSDNQTLHLLI